MCVCACVQLQDVCAVELSVCLLYTEAVCTVVGPAIHFSAPVPTQLHPLPPAFLNSSFNTASRQSVNSVGNVIVLFGEV